MPAHAPPFNAPSPASRSGAARLGTSRRFAPFVLAALTVLVGAMSVVALCVGAYRIPLAEAWAALSGDAAAQQARAVLLDIRAPRRIVAGLQRTGRQRQAAR
ncbi:iron ABC transporter permease, partial [Burkholderia orbicola]|nr:iron ABC transporter permease [Burkholderia orbicola]